MTSTELKENVSKIKKLLKQRDYDVIDTGIELARGLNEPAIFEALLGGWSINVEGVPEFDQAYEGETLTRRWSEKTFNFFTYAVIDLMGFHPEGNKLRDSVEKIDIFKIRQLSGFAPIPIPIGLFNFLNLRTLVLTRLFLTSIPDEIGKLKALECLKLDYNDIPEFPSTLINLKNLKNLDLSNNDVINQVPKEITGITSLKYLNMTWCKSLSLVPDDIGKLTNLENLSITYTKVKGLPESFGKLINLKHLDLTWNELEKLPESIDCLKKLSSLNLYNNQLYSLPVGIFKLNTPILLCSNFSDPRKTHQWIESLNKKIFFEKLLFNFFLTDTGVITYKPDMKWAGGWDTVKMFYDNIKSGTCNGFIIGNNDSYNIFANSFSDCNLDDSFIKENVTSISVNTIPSNISEFKNLKNITIASSDLNRYELIGCLEKLEVLTIGTFPFKTLPNEFSSLKNLIELNINSSVTLEDLDIIINLPKLQKLNLSGCESLKIPPKSYDMVFEKDIKKYKIKLIEASGLPTPKYLQQGIKASKEIKSSFPKIKKFLKKRDYDSINIGLELIKSLNEHSLYEMMLDGCSIDSSGCLIRSRMLSGSGPAQVYLDYVILSLIKDCPQDALNINESLYHKNISKLNLSTVSPFNIKKTTQRYDLTNHDNSIISIINSFIFLEELNLSRNNIANKSFKENMEFIFDSFSSLKNLKRLNLSFLWKNKFGSGSMASLPSNISLLSYIEELYISGNDIWELPDEFVELSSLKILGLAGNASLVPEEIINKIGKLKKLRKLYISSNGDMWSKAEGRKAYDMEKTFEKLKKLIPELIIDKRIYYGGRGRDH